MRKLIGGTRRGGFLSLFFLFFIKPPFSRAPSQFFPHFLFNIPLTTFFSLPILVNFIYY